jgi:hypothetical protein
MKPVRVRAFAAVGALATAAALLPTGAVHPW